jgi:acyl-coenzyme A thioesterase PaaI-like protein
LSEAIVTEESETALRARSQGACFVCGRENPHGLQIEFERQEGGEASATWTPGRALEGFRGIVHGGVVSTVLDEAMSKAVAATGNEALTAELRVRFRRHVRSTDTFLIRGWVVKQYKRLIEAEATLTALDGTERAHAWARFLSLPEIAPGLGSIGAADRRDAPAIAPCKRVEGMS